VLSVDLTSRRGGFSLEAAFDQPAPSTLALVGENGAGKTTLLRLIAGLEKIERGRVTFDSAIWSDAAAGVHVPAGRRGVGWVPQDYALFPHLDALANVAFGLRARGIPVKSAREKAQAALTRLGVERLATRRPGELSGGQQQRVALARALVLEPRLLLLDEPLAALDARTRGEVRALLTGLLADYPGVTVIVTHHAVEAMMLADRIAVLEQGRITQLGVAAELVRHPRSAYVAALMGVNLLRGVRHGAEPDGMATFAAGSAQLTVPDAPGEGAMFAVVDPRDVTISITRPEGSARNVLEGEVLEVVPELPAGERVRVAISSDPPLVAEVTRGSAVALGLVPGQRVFATFKATGVTTFR
jgi:molybdate transport system ATP-binding protein